MVRIFVLVFTLLHNHVRTSEKSICSRYIQIYLWHSDALFDVSLWIQSHGMLQFIGSVTHYTVNSHLILTLNLKLWNVVITTGHILETSGRQIFSFIILSKPNRNISLDFRTLLKVLLRLLLSPNKWMFDLSQTMNIGKKEAIFILDSPQTRQLGLNEQRRLVSKEGKLNPI